ncbi:MAG: cupredoxin domain-containing protein [Solirubrobacteraceae bacterium]|jgi:plastocyanin
MVATNRFPAVLACLAIGGLAAGGCGGGRQTGGATETTSERHTPTSSQAGPTTNPKLSRGLLQVAMKNIKFIPANIKVKKGQTVIWTNEDGVVHTVTATSGASFDSGNLNPGVTYKWKASGSGTIHYFCKIHGQQQSGTITVTG